MVSGKLAKDADAEVQEKNSKQIRKKQLPDFFLSLLVWP
jgi:hypothetical protein